MMQWFRGNIEGYYVGRPDRSGAVAGPNARTFQLVVYRAAICDVELVDFVPPPPSAHTSHPIGATNGDAAIPSPEPPAADGVDEPLLVLPPWLPAPGAAFFQPTITDARLFPVRHAMGWFEGPVHQVFVEQFRSTHSKQEGGQVYGRFVGRAQGYFALPPPPRPEAAERVVRAFQDVPEDATPVFESNARALARDLERDHARVIAASRELSVSSTPGVRALPAATSADVAATLTAPASATEASPSPRTPSAPDEGALNAAPGAQSKRPRRAMRGRVPFLILVVLVAVGLLITCGAPRALLWLFFLLPTLLLRRIVSTLIPDNTALRGFSAVITVGQLWLAGMVFISWWETGCRDVHPVPLLGTLVGLAIASILPSDTPLLVHASTLAALLLGWCTSKDTCGAHVQLLPTETHESRDTGRAQDDRS